MDTKDILVTVITVTYNSSVYVRDAIESVLAQSHTNIEYIIGDDFSTDSTWQIIQEYKDLRIIAYRNDTNLGEYPNRNKAIDMAKGKYLIFIDGDDIIYSHGIDFFVKMMEEFPAAAFAVQKNYYNNIVYPVLLSPSDIIINYFFGKVSFLTSSFASNFFRTDLLKSVGGLSMKYKTGDEEIRLRLASKYPILLVAGWVTWPRETPGQASSKLDNGVGVIELYKMVKDLDENKLLNNLGDDVKAAILEKTKDRLKFLATKKILKGNIVAGKKILKIVGLQWKDILSYSNVRLKDFLEDYTPSRPFKL